MSALWRSILSACRRSRLPSLQCRATHVLHDVAFANLSLGVAFGLDFLRRVFFPTPDVGLGRVRVAGVTGFAGLGVVDCVAKAAPRSP